MRRTTPDLTGSRKTIYHSVSIGLMTLTVLYVVWTNYVIFVGGNLPLTGIDLGDGSTGAGLAMLFIGDLIIVLAVWLLLDQLLLNLVYMALLPAQRRADGSAPQAAQGQNPPQNAWQGQPQQGWQGQPPQGWQPDPQQGWQGQPQQGWQGQPPQGWQPDPQQGWQGQPQQGGWQPPPPPPGTPYPPSGGEQGRLVGPGGSGWQSPDAPTGQGSPENSSH